MWFNPFMEWLLKSPWHGLISGNTMIIYFKGQKSGKDYHVPVNYLHVDHTLLTVSSKERTWWRNLRCGAAVTVLLRGTKVSAHACTVEDEPGITESLKTLIEKNPRMAGVFKVTMGADGQPENESLHQAVSKRVIVRTTLD
jgi:hypothetical protein